MRAQRADKRSGLLDVCCLELLFYLKNISPFVFTVRKNNDIAPREATRQDGSMIVVEGTRKEEGPYLHFTSPTPNSLSR